MSSSQKGVAVSHKEFLTYMRGASITVTAMNIPQHPDLYYGHVSCTVQMLHDVEHNNHC